MAEVFNQVQLHQLHVNEKIVNRHGQQAAAIADLAHAAGNPPTKTEYDALVDAVNGILAALRSGSGVGIVAGS
jgi:hypothetical protein